MTNDYSQELKNNNEKFLEVLKEADKELFLIKDALNNTNVNPRTLLTIIYALENIGLNRFGTLSCDVYDSILVSVKSTRNHKVKERVLLDD